MSMLIISCQREGRRRQRSNDAPLSAPLVT